MKLRSQVQISSSPYLCVDISKKKKNHHVTYHQFKKNTKNENENNYTKSKRKQKTKNKKTESWQDLGQTHGFGRS
jgi:hypothetical protein